MAGRLALLLLAILAVSCGPTSRPDYVIHLVNGMGGNPFDMRCRSGDVQVDVQQETNPVLTTHGSLTFGTLSSLTVSIPSYGLLTSIEVTVHCTDGTSAELIGATPRFIPTGYGFVDIVLGQPSTCEHLAMPALRTPRSSPHFVTLGANVLVIGGLEGSMSPSPHVQVLDPVALTYNTAAVEFPMLSIGIGLGAAAPLSPQSLVVASDTVTAIFDATPNLRTPRVVVPTVLHRGAGSESAVVALNGSGVAIIGGFVDGAAVSGITWISTSGTSMSGQMRFPRRRPGAAVVGPNRLLVVGGQAMGDPLFELMAFLSTDPAASMPFGSPSETRYAPVVTTDASHTHAWVGYGETALDVTSTLPMASWELGTCALTCRVTPGQTVTDPRRDVAVVAHHVGIHGAPTTDAYETLVIGGTGATGTSGAIDRITFDDHGAVTLTAFGTLGTHVVLSDVGAAEIGAGVFLVGGGLDAAGTAQQGIEICFPAALEPITAR